MTHEEIQLIRKQIDFLDTSIHLMLEQIKGAENLRKKLYEKLHGIIDDSCINNG